MVDQSALVAVSCLAGQPRPPGWGAVPASFLLLLPLPPRLFPSKGIFSCSCFSFLACLPPPSSHPDSPVEQQGKGPGLHNSLLDISPRESALGWCADARALLSLEAVSDSKAAVGVRQPPVPNSHARGHFVRRSARGDFTSPRAPIVLLMYGLGLHSTVSLIVISVCTR